MARARSTHAIPTVMAVFSALVALSILYWNAGANGQQTGVIDKPLRNGAESLADRESAPTRPSRALPVPAQPAVLDSGAEPLEEKSRRRAVTSVEAPGHRRVPSASEWTALPVLQAPFNEIAGIREELALRYRDATHQRTIEECFNNRYSTGPPRTANLVLNVEAGRDQLYVSDAIVINADEMPAALAECFVRTHRGMFLDVRGATEGRFRIEWPIAY